MGVLCDSIAARAATIGWPIGESHQLVLAMFIFWAVIIKKEEEERENRSHSSGPNGRNAYNIVSHRHFQFSHFSYVFENRV